MIEVPINKVILQNASGYIVNHGVISIESKDYSRVISNESASWLEIPNLGRTGSSITPIPVTLPRINVSGDSPRLEYDFFVTETGTADITVYLSPTLNYMKNEGLHYAISIDDEEPRLVNIHEGETVPDWKYPVWWNVSVTENIKKKTSAHSISAPGQHTLKLWMVDPGLVFQKIVIDQGGLKESYLGPPESIYLKP